MEVEHILHLYKQKLLCKYQKTPQQTFLSKWLQPCHVTKMKSTINHFDENNSKLLWQFRTPDEAIQYEESKIVCYLGLVNC